MVDFPPQCASFFERDSEYPDLECREPAAKRYVSLIHSANYRSNCWPDVNDVYRKAKPVREDVPLPVNLLTEEKKITAALKVKILGALAICPLPSTFQIRVYQLFHLAKFSGWRYNYKSNCWEQD